MALGKYPVDTGVKVVRGYLPLHLYLNNFELIASVSRSGGIDKDGDALKDPRIQEGYQDFIKSKLDEYWIQYPPDRSSNMDASDKAKLEKEGNLLIQVRKLREGIYAARRRDAFSVAGAPSVTYVLRNLY
ncbi:hypothetical protein K488DRAFT_82015 [Vararia minispora EC-137]|uniref:Uncharacterized protein n=1 Tax=Vararia minispora EC-137 TaxID=1314806 RepID=A0ACB8QYY6_9AGAM|nr:hypothetical protein K488DRAFT_82015 [Vararia minispora EC-137]